MGWQSRGGAARGCWLIPPEPGCQLEAQPRSTRSPAPQGAGGRLLKASTGERRLYLQGAEDRVLGQPASVPSRALLRTTTSISAAQQASGSASPELSCRQARRHVHRGQLGHPPAPAPRPLEGHCACAQLPGAGPRTLPGSSGFSTTACRTLPRGTMSSPPFRSLSLLPVPMATMQVLSAGFQKPDIHRLGQSPTP